MMATPRFSVLGLLIPLVLIVAVVWGIMIGWRRRKTPLPEAYRYENLRRPDWRFRLVDTALAAVMSGWILGIMMLGREHGGAIIRVENLPEGGIEWLNQLRLMYGGLWLLAVTLVAWGKGRSGIFLMVGTLILFVFSVQNGNDTYYRNQWGGGSSGYNGPTRIILNVTTESGDVQVEGVDLWANDIYLGQTPVTITQAEFFSMVPAWPEKPGDYDARMGGEDRIGYAQSFRNRGSRSGYRWQNFRIEKIDQYYLRAEWHGEPVGMTRGWGSSGSNNEVSYRFRVSFAGRDERFRNLLNQARGLDYDVSSEWLAVANSYGEEAWNRLDDLAGREPGFDTLLKGLERARQEAMLTSMGLTLESPPMAIFEAILEAADREDRYSTLGPLGQLMESLIPQLDADAVANRAVRRLKGNLHPTSEYTYGERNGQFHFSHNDDNSHLSSSTSGGGSGNVMTGGDYALVHAVWKIDEYLDAQGEDTPNPMEERVSPALFDVGRGRRYGSNLSYAVYLGGEAVDQYISGYADMKEGEWRVMMNLKPLKEGRTGSGFWKNVEPKNWQRWRYYFPEPNQQSGSSQFGLQQDGAWFMAMMRLDEPLARAFRQRNRDLIQTIADTVWASVNYAGGHELRMLKMFFSDQAAMEDGKSWFEAYWPTLLKPKAQSIHDIFQIYREILSWMEPETPVAFYAQAVEAYLKEQVRIGNSYVNFDWTNLAPARRIPILEAVLAGLETIETTEGEKDKLLREVKERAVNSIRDGLFMVGQMEAVEQVIGEWEAQSRFREAEALVLWLRDAAEDGHPALERMARSESPELQRAALKAIEGRPTPAFRNVLTDTLMKSDHMDIRSESQAVQLRLDALKEEPPEQWNAIPQTPAAPDIGVDEFQDVVQDIELR